MQVTVGFPAKHFIFVSVQTETNRNTNCFGFVLFLLRNFKNLVSDLELKLNGTKTDRNEPK
jgi:hypothetical protein